ncbi:glycosyltransferase family 2 protein [Pseudomonas sp. Gutcm_11s]|uniref:glycosyltransferase family 2 protein n=1 Tax=Pseudomonas sp. Gutcm_11s TaxID=3026088 RepID=UPI00235E7D11|nr:glycosyltransferase family 2 protein [Pseudomonas sp. Gutcm_11s]MDD0841203.1 glycosyltransferase family 2 protein [Pseudomonas sp. Gutcm_11s]
MRSDVVARSSVVILTLNAERYLPGLFAAFAALPEAPRRVLFIDSESSDTSAELIRAAGFELHAIRRSEFGHGSTRNLGLSLCADSEFVVFLTQDACPQGADWLKQLLEPFDDPQVALVYGRQLPRPGSKLAERFAREFNYPAVADRTGMADLASRGIKAVFCSNSFSAYRRQALQAAGGFPEALPMGEDMAAALRLLQRGGVRVYQPLALAVHSHAYSLAQELRRYFDIGTLMAMDDELSRVRLASSGEGMRFLRGELSAALSPLQPLAVIGVLTRTFCKYLGFALGQRYRLLPLSWRQRLSMHAYFWSQP